MSSRRLSIMDWIVSPGVISFYFVYSRTWTRSVPGCTGRFIFFVVFGLSVFGSVIYPSSCVGVWRSEGL